MLLTEEVQRENLPKAASQAQMAELKLDFTPADSLKPASAVRLSVLSAQSEANTSASSAESPANNERP